MCVTPYCTSTVISRMPSTPSATAPAKIEPDGCGMGREKAAIMITPTITTPAQTDSALAAMESHPRRAVATGQGRLDGAHIGLRLRVVQRHCAQDAGCFHCRQGAIRLGRRRDRWRYHDRGLFPAHAAAIRLDLPPLRTA